MSTGATDADLRIPASTYGIGLHVFSIWKTPLPRKTSGSGQDFSTTSSSAIAS